MRRAIVASVVCAAAATTAVAQPDARKEAGQHFQRGQAAQAAKRYRDAIAEYAQAYALVPHPNALYNIAVCYERLGESARAADYYARYLEADPDAADAAAVRAKIDALGGARPAVGGGDGAGAGDVVDDRDATGRDMDGGAGDGASTGPATPPMIGAPTGGDAAPPPATWGAPPPGGGGITTIGPPVVRPPGRGWHLGASYGVGFGDVPVQRYLVRAGLRPIERLDADVVLGGFGKNDHAIGVDARLHLARGSVTSPFVHAAATIGLARQDDSSAAALKFPFGFEVGGGVELGRTGKGRFELGATVRWVRNGWDAASTVADSYVNDAIAVGVDLGIELDVPITVAPR